MQPKTVAKRCRQTEEKDSHSMLRAILDKVVEYMTNPTIKKLNESNWPFHDTDNIIILLFNEIYICKKNPK